MDLRKGLDREDSAHITRQAHCWIRDLTALLGSGRTKDIGASLDDVDHVRCPAKETAVPGPFSSAS